MASTSEHRSTSARSSSGAGPPRSATLLRAAATRRADLAARAARGHPRPARRGTSVLGDRPSRGHPPHLARPAVVLLGRGDPVRRRPAGAAGGFAVVPRDGRTAPHEATGSRVGRLHAAPGGPHRGGHPRQRAADRGGGRAHRRRRLRRADRQAASAGDDLGHDRGAPGGPRAGGVGGRRARVGGRSRVLRRPPARRGARRSAVDADRSSRPSSRRTAKSTRATT